MGVLEGLTVLVGVCVEVGFGVCVIVGVNERAGVGKVVLVKVGIGTTDG